MRRSRPLLLCAALALATLGPVALAQETAPPAWKSIDSITPERALAASQVHDVDGDGDSELILVDHRGLVQVWHFRARAGQFAEKPFGALRLPHPERSLLAIADMLNDGSPPQLVVLSPDGLCVHPVGKDGAFEADAIPIASRARFTLRVGSPRFVPFTQDVNGDSRPDVIVPRGESCDLYIEQADVAREAGTKPRYRRSARVPVDLDSGRSIKSERLSHVLESTFRIPRVRFDDVNADGRLDLLVSDGDRRAWHLQAEDGSFSGRPTTSVDLDVFQDTTPEAEVRLGRTLAGQDKQRMQSVDLDADGIPDYVIAHRRKVWVFHGTREGPQFTDPSTVLRVAEDVTAMLTADLDEDGRDDLLLVRVQIPTVATILRGLVASWDIDIRILGYANADGKRFETSPRWTSDLALRLPAIFDIVRDADALIARFENVQDKFRDGVFEDFDGDGTADLAMPTTDGTRFDYWRASADPSDHADSGATFRRLLFENDDNVWDIDRIVSFLGGAADDIVAQLTGGRDADGSYELLDDEELRLESLRAGRFAGGRGDLLVEYRILDGTGRSRFDVLRLGK